MEDFSLSTPEFDEAFEKARLAALQAAQANTSESAQDPATIIIEDDDEDDEIVIVPGDTSEEDESDDEESDDDPDDDDDSEDESEDSENEHDESESDPDEVEAEAVTPKKKTRRGKTIARLKETNSQLQARLAERDQETSDLEERVTKRVQDAQRQIAELEHQRRQRDQEDAQIEQEVLQYLGTEQDYRAAVRAALNGDQEAAKRARIWDANREVVTKLARRAEGFVKKQAAEIFWTATADLDGVDRNILQTASLGQLLPYLHKTGYDIGFAAGQQELEKLQKKISRLEARGTEDKIKKATKAPQPIDTGKPVKPTKQKTIFGSALAGDISIDDALDRLAGRSPLLV